MIEDREFIFDVPPGSTRATIEVSSFVPVQFAEAKDLRKAALVSVHLTDSEGEIVIPSDDDLAISKKVGPYSYLNSGVGKPQTTVVDISVPAECARVIVTARTWVKEIETYLTAAPKITFEEDPAKNLLMKSQINEAIKNIRPAKKVIILYTTAPGMDHPSLGLRPNRLARVFAQMGHRVIFFPFGSAGIENTRYAENIYQFTRDILPELNDRLSRLGASNVVFICSSFPDVNAIAATDLAKSFGWNTVYEVRDDMEEFNRVGYSKWYHRRLEMYMAQRSNFVVTVSPYLARKMVMMGAQESTTTVIPNGVDREFFTKTAGLRTAEAFSSRAKSRTIGYIGHLTPSWFDWPLVLQTARKNPSLQFEIIGHGAPNNINIPSNINLLGPRTHDEFLVISRGWRMGIIPFRKSRLTYSVDPNKLYEYLCVGIPVVSARMASVDTAPLTRVYYDDAQFADLLVENVQGYFKYEDLESLEDYLSKCFWDQRGNEMMSFIAGGGGDN